MAFEMARQLEQEGQAVALLALFDSKRARTPSHARRSDLASESLGRTVHVRTLLHGPGRLAYVGQKVRTARRLVRGSPLADARAVASPRRLAAARAAERHPS